AAAILERRRRVHSGRREVRNGRSNHRADESEPRVGPVVIDGPVRNAANLFEPRAGEIDLRFRERLQLRPRTHLGVAQLVLDDGGDAAGALQSHQLGLRFLIREIGLTSPYRGRWGGTVRLGYPIP